VFIIFCPPFRLTDFGSRDFPTVLIDLGLKVFMLLKGRF
jgi:hypothetical protein